MTTESSKFELVLYPTEDGRTGIQCRLEAQSLWLTQAQRGALFQTSVPNINRHLKAIFEDGDLAEQATITSHVIVRREGARQVTRAALHSRLAAVPRVRSRRGESQ